MIMILFNTWMESLYYVFIYLACFIGVNMIYLFKYAGFQWLMQVQQHIYLQDYTRHSVAVS